MAILLTDLVGFSDWALSAGDEAALEVVRAPDLTVRSVKRRRARR